MLTTLVGIVLLAALILLILSMGGVLPGPGRDVALLLTIIGVLLLAFGGRLG